MRKEIMTCDEYKYKVSIVMAVYNVEPYLRDAIDSVIKQTIGFEHIQLILVNDGSSDDSGLICDEYAEKYSNNIQVIHKENAGVSSARNEGLKYVQGQYVNFMDSDDKLSKRTIAEVCKFFDRCGDNVDLVSIPLYFFEGQKGKHTLNDKYENGTRIVDLETEWSYAQLSFASAFVKKECIMQYQFDTNLAYAEDAQLILKILCDKKKLGVISSSKYMYRKRIAGQESAVQASGKTESWYMPYLEHFIEHIINYCKSTMGYVPKFVQNTLMYDLQWRFRQSEIPEGIMTTDREKAYKARLISVLSEISDEVIFAQRSLNVEQKAFLMRKKYPDMIPTAKINPIDRKMWYCLNGTFAYKFEDFQLRIDFVKINGDRVVIEGAYAKILDDYAMPKICVLSNGEQYFAQENHFNNLSYSIGEPTINKIGFKVVVPLQKKVNKLEFVVKYDSFTVRPKKIILGKYCPVSYGLENSYYYNGKYLLLPRTTGFDIKKVSKKEVLQKEKAVIKELLKKKEKAATEAAILRVLTYLLRKLVRKLVRKDIWLITDKADRADDNGEAFFIYCRQNRKKANCFPVFAISRKSSDYKRMKKYGPVISYMSWLHKLCHLIATHTISAYSHDEISSPFHKESRYYCDLMQRNKIVFLQHGIIKDDLSKGLNRYHKNYSLFVTSTKPEWDSVVQYNYGYSEQEVILTGLPRYDRLYDNKKKKITIMPTWRRKLFGPYDPQTSKWELLPGFENSEFYNFYSDLLNSDKLHSVAEKCGYEIQFLIHPTLFPYLDYFSVDPRVTVLNSDVTYRDVFAESDLILTDYSSAVFDMVYLRKPVLYAHFDSNHYDEGYFNYERDGFGEVEYTLEDTINRIIEYMENDCQLKTKYRKRIDEFFMYDDKKNCERVFDKIMDLDSKKS